MVVLLAESSERKSPDLLLPDGSRCLTCVPCDSDALLDKDRPDILLLEGALCTGVIEFAVLADEPVEEDACFFASGINAARVSFLEGRDLPSATVDGDPIFVEEVKGTDGLLVDETASVLSEASAVKDCNDPLMLGACESPPA